MKFLKKYSLAIFCLLAVTTIFAFSKIEAASIGTITAGDNGNPNAPAGTCIIPLGSSTCLVNVNWTVYQPGQNVRVTSISGTNYPAVLVSGVIAGPYLYTASYTASPIKFTLYNNDNDEYASEASISLSCASGSYWNSSQAKCVASPSGDLYGYPTYTGSTCSVPEGASTCNIGMAWYTDNPLYATYSAITTPGKPTVKTANSSIAVYALTANESRNFFLYHNGVILDQEAFTASCASGTTWNGSICEGLPPPEVKVIASLLNGVELEKDINGKTKNPINSGEKVNISWTPNNINATSCECSYIKDGEITPSSCGFGTTQDTEAIGSPFTLTETKTFSVTCLDDTQPITNTNPTISNIQTYNTMDEWGNACDIYDTGGTGKCFYDSTNDYNYVVMMWQTENIDTCVDTTFGNRKNPIPFADLGEGKKLWAWDGNNNDNISGTNNITCTKSSTSENKSFSFTFYDYSENTDPSRTLVTTNGNEIIQSFFSIYQ